MSSDAWGSEPPSVSRWRRLLPLAVIAAAVAVVGTVLAPRQPGEPGAILDVQMDVSPAPAPTTDAGPSDAPVEEGAAPASPPPHADQVRGEWVEIGPEPTPMQWGQASAWTGSELFVWGGEWGVRLAGRPIFTDGGAAFDPQTRLWRTLAGAPLLRRREAAAAWTGSEVVVWGGAGEVSHFADGAAYDPHADAWRQITASPLSPRAGAAAVWTGTEMLVVGGSDNAGPLADGAAYNPSADSWRPLPDLPPGVDGHLWLAGVWAGDAAVVWPRGGGAPGAILGVRYVVEDDAWAVLPDAEPGMDAIGDAVWSGDALYALLGRVSGPGRSIARLSADGRRWEAVADAPWLDSGSTMGWTDRGLALLTGSRTHWLFEPVAGIWLRLPTGPAIDASENSPPVWTGAELLAWKQSTDPANPRRGVVFRFAEPAADDDG